MPRACPVDRYALYPRMNVFLTVDVDVYYTGDYDLEARGHGLGVDYILDVCNRYGLRSTFFVDAMGATQWGEDQVRMICDLIQGAQHDVQLHLHPNVARIDGFEDTWDLLWHHDRDTQSMLLGLGVEILNRCGVQTVNGFRAGALAANEDTLCAMQEHGLTLGSNRDRDLKSSLESKLNDLFPVQNDVSRVGSVTDLPVSVLRSPIPWTDGTYRHLEVCALGAMEMRDALIKLERAGVTCATILTHPKEFFYMKDGKEAIPIQKNRRRLEHLVKFLAGWESANVVTFGDWRPPVELPSASPPEMRLNPLFSMMRLIEQGIYRVERKLSAPR